MIVLRSRYCIEPTEVLFYTDKNKGTKITHSLKSAKRFKTIQQIDDYFSNKLSCTNEEFNWQEFYCVRNVKHATESLSIQEYKPTGTVVIRNEFGFYCSKQNEGFVLSGKLIDAKIFNSLQEIVNELGSSVLNTFEVKGCFYGTNGLVLNRP